MAVHVDLTDSEAELLTDIIEWWAFDLPEARDDTIKDRTLRQPEDVLKLSNSIDEQIRMCETIKEKLRVNHG